VLNTEKTHSSLFLLLFFVSLQKNTKGHEEDDNITFGFSDHCCSWMPAEQNA
jgi:hypothetical protein